MDSLTKKQREIELLRIAEAERKRQQKIENFDKMSPELRKKLNARKSRMKKFIEWLKLAEKPKQPKQPKPISEEQQRLREIAKRIHEEDSPKESWGVNLWHKEEKKTN